MYLENQTTDWSTAMFPSLPPACLKIYDMKDQAFLVLVATFGYIFWSKLTGFDDCGSLL